MGIKIEYPKWIYHDTLSALIVKDKEEHLVKQKEGYHQHDGTLIGEQSAKPAEIKEPVVPKEPEEPEITFTKSEAHGVPEKRKAGRPKKR